MFKRLYNQLWLWFKNGAKFKWHPVVTLEMKQAGLTWALVTYEDGSKEWGEVCDFCHGNCGQCGITGRVGNIAADLGAIVKNGNWDSGNHAGL